MKINIHTPQKDLFKFFESDDFKEAFEKCRDSDLHDEANLEPPAYYTLVQFFYNSHNDSAVDVKVFNKHGKCMGGYIFKWPEVDEITSINLLTLSEMYTEYLEKKYSIKCQYRETFYDQIAEKDADPSEKNPVSADVSTELSIENESSFGNADQSELAEVLLEVLKSEENESDHSEDNKPSDSWGGSGWLDFFLPMGLVIRVMVIAAFLLLLFAVTQGTYTR